MALALACFAPRLTFAGPVGSIFSGVTAADPASPYWNAAAMTLLHGTQGLLYLSLGEVRARFNRATPSAFDGVPYPAATFHIASPDPALGIVTDFGLRDWRFGLAVSIPWADGVGWDEQYEGRPAATRYYGMRPVIGQLLIGPAVAYRINRFISLGVGLDIGVVLVKHQFYVDFGARVNQIVCTQLGSSIQSCPLDAPLPREDPLLAGRVDVNGLALDVGVFGGLLVTPWPWLRLGVGVHSNGGRVGVPITVDVAVPPRAVDFIQQSLPGVAPSAIKANGVVDVALPVLIAAGIGVIPRDDLEFALDFHWMGTAATTSTYTAITRTTSALIDNVTSVKGRRNHYMFALRGAYRFMPDLTAGLRIEYSSNTRPEEFTSPTSLDSSKTSLHLGLAWRLTRWIELIVEYAYYFIADRNIRVSRFGPKAAPTTDEEKGLDLPSPTGLYQLSGQRGALGARFSF